MTRTCLIAAVLLGAASVHAEPDAEALGKARGYPIGTTATINRDEFKVGSFSHVDKVQPVREVSRGTGPVQPLRKAGAEPAIGYMFRGQRYTLDDYLEHQRVTGLLVLRGDEILVERYRYDRRDDQRFISFSMGKSVTSLLIGIAAEKRLLSLDDPAEKYVTELKGSLFGAATVRQLLRMSAGVKFTEEYDGKDDSAKVWRATLGVGPAKPLELLAGFNDGSFAAGEKFAYSSAQTMVLGYVLSRATGRDVASLTSEWLWQALGAEANAAWTIGVDGQEGTAGGFNATLRDYARLGKLLANDGRIGERQVLPLDYLLEATDAARQPPAFQPRTMTPYMGYGYQFWLMPFKSRTFALIGIYGQTIYVQPASKLVLVHTAVNATPKGETTFLAERDAMWRGVLRSLGGKVD